MTDSEKQRALELARQIVRDADPRRRTYPSHQAVPVAEALLAAHADLERCRAVCEAAVAFKAEYDSPDMSWRAEFREVTARAVLFDAIDAMGNGVGTT